MKITKQDIYVFFKILFAIISYVLIATILFQYTWDVVVYCLMHTILASITTTCIMSTILSDSKRDSAIISLGSICLYTLNAYYIISCIKYGKAPNYGEFISDNATRFFGSLLAFFSIIIAIRMLNRQKRKEWNKNASYIQKEGEIPNNSIIAVVGTIALCFYQVIDAFRSGSNYNTTRTWNTPSEAFFAIVIDLVSCLIIMFAVNLINKKKILTWIPISLYIVSVLISTIISGSRSDFIRPVIIVLFALLVLRKVNIKKLVNVTCIMPLCILLFTVFIFEVSNRMDMVSLQQISNNMTYRFDLSDFSMTMLSRTGFFKIDFSTFLDGIKKSIPSFFLPSDFKSSLMAYEDMLSANGLVRWKDYTDTYLSMGTEIFGVLGLLFFPGLFIHMWEWLDKRSRKLYATGILVKISIVGWVIIIERAWIEMFPLLRNMVLYIIFAVLLERIFVRYRSRTNANKIESWG